MISMRRGLCLKCFMDQHAGGLSVETYLGLPPSISGSSNSDFDGFTVLHHNAMANTSTAVMPTPTSSPLAVDHDLQSGPAQPVTQVHEHEHSLLADGDTVPCWQAPLGWQYPSAEEEHGVGADVGGVGLGVGAGVGFGVGFGKHFESQLPVLTS